jgi:predicted trehalose synthase
MIVEKVANNQILISFSTGTDVFGVQRLIDYAKYLEATSKSEAKQADIDELANEINANWWNENQYRFLR